jgi:hypothetical protein
MRTSFTRGSRRQLMRLAGAAVALAIAGDQQTPEALRAFHAAEIEKWWPLIKAANLKAN